MQEHSPQKEAEVVSQDLTITDSGILAVADRAERLVGALKIIRAAVLRLTNEQDWENLGDKPYLNEGGAKKVGTAFGVSWQFENEPQAEEYDDGHYSYTVSGKFLFRGSEIDELGTASSRDPFFSRAKGQELPPSEINRNNVRKKAITNCIGRGVKGILALKNYTWEELHAAGVEKEKIRKVEYKEEAVLPNYGDFAKQAIANAPTEALQKYLAGLAKSLQDPGKARFKQANERTKQAIEKVLAEREAHEQTKTVGDGQKPAQATEQPAQNEPAPQSPTNTPPPPDTELVFDDYLRDIRKAATVNDVTTLYNAAADSGNFTPQQLTDLLRTRNERIQALQPQPAGKKR